MDSFRRTFCISRVMRSTGLLVMAGCSSSATSIRATVLEHPLDRVRSRRKKIGLSIGWTPSRWISAMRGPRKALERWATAHLTPTWFTILPALNCICSIISKRIQR